MDQTELKSGLYIYNSSALLKDLNPVILKGVGTWFNVSIPVFKAE